MSDTGGFVVPESVSLELAGAQLSDNILRLTFPAPEPLRLTRRQRLRVTVWEWRYRVAKVIYPPSYRDDL